ncbi:thioesterase family protein, partial [Escherichia coli]|nr:thioesterase family protein [Escherichia coli]
MKSAVPFPASGFEPKFVAALKDIFEDKIAFNRVLGLQITQIVP